MDIAKQLKVTHAKIYYWIKRYRIRTRSRSESSYLKHNPNGDPFSIKKKLNNKENNLLISGLMLYAAEGHRKNKHSIQLSNLDYRILRLFVLFLREICGVCESKISLYVQVYKKFNKKEAKNYWAKVLKIPIRQIGVYTHTDKRSKMEGQKSRFGIARVQVHNYKLKKWLDKKLDYYLNR